MDSISPTIPIVGVGGGYGWFDPASPIPYVFTDNAAIGRLGAAHLLACGFETLAYYGHPQTATTGWSEERAEAFAGACREAGRACHVHASRYPDARRWQELQHELCEWLRPLPKPCPLPQYSSKSRQRYSPLMQRSIRPPQPCAQIGSTSKTTFASLVTHRRKPWQQLKTTQSRS
jgi:hypothetical protein